MININDFNGLKIGIASPEKIREWSYGEVKKPETINYRTNKPERDGLFCEKIFGPTKDYECACGKYKRLRYKDVVCDRCGVEVTKSKVRRERMGHIELACPVSHIWFFKGVPSKIGTVLDLSPRDLEEVLYFVSYIVINPGNTSLEKKQILSEREYRAYYEKYGTGFEVGIGAEAIQKLLAEIDIESEIDLLQKEAIDATLQKKERIVKRLDVLESFRLSGNLPEWMILTALPVNPPDLRPIIPLDGGRFATVDLNDLYRRIINRNNRLKKLIELNAPMIIVQNEKRMLQEAVDALIDNGRRGKAVTGAGNRPFKSLSNMLKGKQGRFRQNLLGKRVDYSGRSVIVVGPELKMYQCGLPKEMALELFKPYIIKGLIDRDIAHNIKTAKRLIEVVDDSVWDIVEETIKEYPVLLNRAPTLHRLGIQAFEPKLIDGKAISLHPLVTPAFNADFDGDQMAVHVPLSEEAKAEARLLMLGTNNILNPKDGSPIVTPSQDMVLGNYYLTIERANEPGEGRVFKNSNEAIMAYERREISLHTRIILPVKSFKYKVFTIDQQSMYLLTTPGKLIFNDILPDSFPYINEGTIDNIDNITPMKYFYPYGTDFSKVLKDLPLVKAFGKKTLEDVIAGIYRRYKTTETAIMLDNLKDLGFKYSTVAGITISMSDIITTPKKEKIIEEANSVVTSVNKQFKRGLITDAERHQEVIKIWKEAKDKVSDALATLTNDDTNPLFLMINSKARGNIGNLTQIAGMRGTMAKPNGEPVEIPITSSFLEGLSISELFLSTHGARKGTADTALGTADAGYLTRKLVDVVQDVIVREDDCHTLKGLVVKEIMNEKKDTVIVELFDRIIGMYTNQKIIHPDTKEVICDRQTYIDEKVAKQIIEAGVKEVEIRSPLTCKLENGVCTKCYGKNLATGSLVEVGEAVGVLAAQSIGEPGTQLTMRTFHMGGVAGDDITQGLPRIVELFEARIPKVKATISEIDGVITKIREKNGKHIITIKNNLEEREHVTNYSSKLRVEKGENVIAGRPLTEGHIAPKELLAVTDPITVQEYILKELQMVYRNQGIPLSDKHISVIAKRMISRVKIVDAGDTDFLVGTIKSINEFSDGNKDVILKGKRPAISKPVLLGITKASLETESFLSAASFQETTKVLTDAAMRGKVDRLVGLKENVIIGKLIPAGTGSEHYRNIDFSLENEFCYEEPIDMFEEKLMN